jgi:aspartokinase
MAFVELTEGELEPGPRSACESTLFERLEASGVTPEMVAINSAGCFFTVDERDTARVRAAVASLNVALHLRNSCARVALTRGEADWPLPSLARVLVAIGARGVDVVHVTADASAVNVVVAESDVGQVVGTLAAFCQPKASRNAA